jgi:glutaredoxin
MKEAAENLGSYLSEKFGDGVKFAYVDVTSDEMKNYPDIAAILSKVNLPLIVINGKPRFHGGITLIKVEKLVNELLAKA